MLIDSLLFREAHYVGRLRVFKLVNHNIAFRKDGTNLQVAAKSQ
jgi:hypothetical protein